MTGSTLICLITFAIIFVVVPLVGLWVMCYFINHAPLAIEDPQRGFIILEEPEGSKRKP